MRYLNLKSLYCDVNLLNPNYFIVTVTYGIIFGGGDIHPQIHGSEPSYCFSPLIYLFLTGEKEKKKKQ